jgi:hypothetical protein
MPCENAIDGAVDSTSGVLAFKPVAEKPKTGGGAAHATSSGAATADASARLHRRQYWSRHRPDRSRAASRRFQRSLHSLLSRGYDKTLRDASSRATKAFYPALSCDLIFSGADPQRNRPCSVSTKSRMPAMPNCRASAAASARNRRTMPRSAG